MRTSTRIVAAISHHMETISTNQAKREKVQEEGSKSMANTPGLRLLQDLNKKISRMIECLRLKSQTGNGMRVSLKSRLLPSGIRILDLQFSKRAIGRYRSNKSEESLTISLSSM